MPPSDVQPHSAAVTYLWHSQLFGSQGPHQAMLLLLTLHAGSSCTEQSGPL
jgi:hypothetical protein